MFNAIVRFVVELAKEVKTFRPSVEKARAKIVTSGSKTRRKRTAVMIATIATVTGSLIMCVSFSGHAKKEGGDGTGTWKEPSPP